MATVKNQPPDYQREPDNGFIPDAINRSTTPLLIIPPESSGTTVQVVNNSFMDDVARYMETPQSMARNAELLRVRNQAMTDGNFDPSNPKLIARQDSDPSGG